jgi:cytochrome c oxidase cbb3-type subunit 2
MINNAKADLMAQANGLANHDDLIYRYPKAVVVDTSDFIGDSEDNVVVTEMDAIVAYLQILGRMAEFDQEQQQ